MKLIKIQDFNSFQDLYQRYNLKKESNELKSLLLLFVASSDPVTKESWCSDCRNAQPIIDKTVQEFEFNEQLVLAVIQVGHKDQWKSSDNPFRTHELKVTAVPTLISLSMVSKSLR